MMLVYFHGMLVFERLDAWQRCHELTLAVYATTRDWPDTERFGLISQVRRAAVSVEANIAEGAAKRGPAEFRRYLDISLGSLAEVTCLLRIAHDLGFLPDDGRQRINEVRERACQVTWRLYQSMSRKSKLSYELQPAVPSPRRPVVPSSRRTIPPPHAAPPRQS
jgi:four helix bundle protein